MPSSFNLRHAWIAVVAAAAVMAPASASAATLPVQLPCIEGVTCPKKPKCANTGVEPAKGNLRLVRRATLCLLNVQRASTASASCAPTARCRASPPATRRQMVSQSFFDHVSPTGSTFVQRILAVGLPRRGRRLQPGREPRLGQRRARAPRSASSARGCSRPATGPTSSTAKLPRHRRRRGPRHPGRRRRPGRDVRQRVRHAQLARRAARRC